MRTLEGLIHEDTTAVSVDTPLSEMFGPSLQSRLPLVVTDEEDRLLGVVPRIALLRAMSDGDEEGVPYAGPLYEPQPGALDESHGSHAVKED